MYNAYAYSIAYAKNNLNLLQGRGTGTSRIVTGMGHGGTMIAMMEEETATGIVMMIGTAETTIEEVNSCGPLDPPASVCCLIVHLKLKKMFGFIPPYSCGLHICLAVWPVALILLVSAFPV